MGRLWRRWELHTACGGETDQIECRKKVVREWLVSFALRANLFTPNANLCDEVAIEKELTVISRLRRPRWFDTYGRHPCLAGVDAG
jgi:hypothetical protein